MVFDVFFCFQCFQFFPVLFDFLRVLFHVLNMFFVYIFINVSLPPRSFSSTLLEWAEEGNPLKLCASCFSPSFLTF